jgi:hypothetical protein
VAGRFSKLKDLENGVRLEAFVGTTSTSFSSGISWFEVAQRFGAPGALINVGLRQIAAQDQCIDEQAHHRFD